MRACRRQLCICRRMPHTPFGRVRSLIFPRPVLFVRSAPLHHRRGQVCLRRGNAPISKGALAFARVACVRVCGRACSARLHAHACLHASMRSTHARMRAPTHTQAHAPTHPRTHAPTLERSHPRTLPPSHARTHAHKDKRMPAHTAVLKQAASAGGSMLAMGHKQWFVGNRFLFVLSC